MVPGESRNDIVIMSVVMEKAKSSKSHQEPRAIRAVDSCPPFVDDQYIADFVPEQTGDHSAEPGEIFQDTLGSVGLLVWEAPGGSDRYVDYDRQQARPSSLAARISAAETGFR